MKRERLRRLRDVLILCAALLAALWFAGAPFVQAALCFDINGDGRDELVLLVWKHGSYGRHRPSWVLRDETGASQHIFIYASREEDGGRAWHPIWMSSALGFSVRGIAEGEEIRGASRSVLVVTASDGTISRWGWLSWGLVRL